METADITSISFVIKYPSMIDDNRLDVEMSNYDRWKYLIMIVLRTLHLLHYIEQGAIGDEAQRSSLQDRVVVCMIAATLQSETLLYDQNCTMARVVMRALEDAWRNMLEFKVYGLRNQLHVGVQSLRARNQLHNIQKKKSTKVDDYISQLKEIRAKLVQATNFEGYDD